MLEVTETLLVQDAERGASTLQQLRDLGVQLALDDFGTGYSSLSYLRNLPLDTLKIAREFVEGLAFSDHDAAFVRLIVGLAKTVGLKVVAEGIETRAQLDMLREIGCDLGQGFYFAAPMDDDADWLAPAAARWPASSARPSGTRASAGARSRSTHTRIRTHCGVSASRNPDQNVTGAPSASLPESLDGWQATNVTTRWPSATRTSPCGSGP